MKAVALVFGVFVAAVGLVGVVAPDALLRIGEYLATPGWIYISSALRVAFGLVLIRVAPVSRAPTALRVLGVITLIAGLITPFVGVDRAHAILEWSRAEGHAIVRFWAALAVIFGGFITYAVAGERRVVA